MVDFLLIGNFVAAHYSEIFPLFKDDVISFGVSRRGMSFINNDVEINSCWFTNLDHPGPGPLTLKKGGEYRKFDNYDAINIDRVEDLVDYDGVIGVPITFMDRYDRRQFEIVGIADNGSGGFDMFCPRIDGVGKFTRLIIRRK